MRKYIKVLEDYTLVLSKDITFKNLKEFIDSQPFPDVWDYFQSFIIAEIVDANPKNNGIAKEFSKLLKQGSNRKVSDFYVKSNLYNPESKSADDDLKIWYHVKFS